MSKFLCFNLSDKLVATGKTTLVVWGEQDSIIPVAHARNFSASGGSSVEVEIFDSAGHMDQMEKANDVNRRLLNWTSHLEATLYSIELTGDQTIVTSKMGSNFVTINEDKDFESNLDLPVKIKLDKDKIFFFDSLSGKRIRS